MKPLQSLIEPLVLTIERQADVGHTEIHKIISDSRKAAPNTVFVALIGSQSDGHDYVAQAAKAGATAIVVQADRRSVISAIPAAYGGLVLVSDNTYRTFAELSSHLYHEPGRHLRMIGVTGTNGKTTVTHLIQQILSEIGDTAGLLGTLGSKTTATDESYEPSTHTTPMADELQSRLAAMRSEGIHSVVMEVSSHALDQYRVAGVDFQVAVVTNLTQDHLDYHKTMDRYFEAKALLFRRLESTTGHPKQAVINLDDAYGARFVAAVPDGVTLWTFGLNNPNATVNATEVDYTITGASYTVHTPAGTAAVRLQMAGEFSVYNSLAGLAAGLSLGIPLAKCVRALEATPSVRGRFEVVSHLPSVIVDYAHTPDGLDNVLQAARKVTPTGGKLWAVFGCGGDRDATKRPKMGRIAEQLADRLVVTSDNPRSEDPQQILTDILSGIERFSPSTMQVEPDRRAAIRQALDAAGAEDVVVIAGKGHEDYQILRHETIHFDDREEVQTYLAQRTTSPQSVA